MKFIHYIAFILSLLFVLETQAQDTLKHKIEIVGRAQQDHIILRWAANTPHMWQLANKYGMKLERFTILRDGKALKTPELKSYPDLFKPLPLEEWEKISENDDYALVAAQAIYGESFEVTEDFSSDIAKAISQTKELEQRHLFALFAADQSKNTALASGLMLEDFDVKENEKYLYTITCPLPTNLPATDTSFIYIGLEDYFPLPAPTGLSADIMNGSVILSWEGRKYTDFYNSYIVERSDDGSSSFHSITDVPIVTPLDNNGNIPEYVFKGDTLIELEKKYIYRVKGINPFGEVSPASDTVSATVNPILNGTPHIVTTLALNDGKMQVRWRFPTAQRDSIVGFRLKRSDKINGNYTILKDHISTRDSIVVDEMPLPSNYYIISAYDQFGNESRSLPFLGMLEDSIPPAAPTGLTGVVDSLGKVTLKWNKNEELDLIGYQVFKANLATEEYIQLTTETITETTFSDSITLNTLTHTVFYTVKALDNHFNPSAFSEVIMLKRPDTIAPTPPQFTNISSESNGIHLSWNNSTSDDVEKHVLYRKTKEQAGWEIIVEYQNNNKVTSYIDNNLEPEKQYAYIIMATDSAGNESPISKPVSMNSKITVSIPEIPKAKARVNYEEKNIELTWEHNSAKVHKYLIYKAQKDEPLVLYKELKSNELSFKDQNIKTNTEYHYRIQASMENGGLSNFSKEMVIKY